MYRIATDNNNARYYPSADAVFMRASAKSIYDAMLRAIDAGSEFSVEFRSGETSISLSQEVQTNENQQTA